MKTKRYTALLLNFALAATILLTAASMSAQITAFDGANELMMTEQSTFLDFLGSTYGPDPGSKLHFTHVVDPAGQSFKMSLDSGSTYLGRPITLSVSGQLVNNQWHLSYSGNYAGRDLNVESKYISPLASGFGFRDLPNYNGYLSYVNFVNTWHPQFSFPVTICSDDWFDAYRAGAADAQYCYVVDTLSGAQYSESAYISYSWGHATVGNPFSWGVTGASTGALHWGSIDTRGVTFTDGSQGFSTSVLSPLTVSTTSFFNDLGTGANVYNPSDGWQVSGNGALGGSFTSASQFTATSSGPVSRIDIGIGHNSGANSFYAALFTDGDGFPSTELARWDNLSSRLDFGQCCGKVSITDVAGLNLTAGNNYFLVLGPEDLNDSSSMGWNKNSQNVSGLQLYSNDGGQTWNSSGQQPLGAFQVLTQPQGVMVEAEQFELAGPADTPQFDLALGYVSGDNALNVVIAVDNGGQPGEWVWRSPNFTVDQHYAGCCSLVSIATQSTLVAGKYWLMVFPSDTQSNTVERWYRNSTGATGLNAFSLDGGSTWNSRGEQLLGAFDIRSGGNLVFSNLGTDNMVYQCCSAYQISGALSNTGTNPSAVIPDKK